MVRVITRLYANAVNPCGHVQLWVVHHDGRDHSDDRLQRVGVASGGKRG